jgi:O-antigen/teichoic acid export membrane protein
LYYERSFKYLLTIGFPIGVGTTLLAARIIRLIYGLEYTPAIIALQVLVWSEVLIFMSVVFGTLLNSINRQIIVTKVCALAAVLNVALNLILIPKYSYIGASIATVATECFAFIFLFTQVSKIGYGLANRSTLRLATKVIVAGSLMGIFAAYFANLNLAILVISSALVYFALIYLFRGIDKTDIELAKHLIRRTGHPED